MKVLIDREKCTGCGLCQDICPQVFTLGEDNIAQVVDSNGCDTADCCREAMESCPSEAIILE